jgi:predicted transcriptional regulator
MKNRSRNDIATEILRIAQDGTMKTKIMYGAYLSTRQINDYLSSLIDNALLEYDNHMRIYKTTAKGIKFYTAFQEMNTLSTLVKKK